MYYVQGTFSPTSDQYVYYSFIEQNLIWLYSIPPGSGLCVVLRRLTWFEFLFHHLLTVWYWVGYLTLLKLSFSKQYNGNNILLVALLQLNNTYVHRNVLSTSPACSRCLVNATICCCCYFSDYYYSYCYHHYYFYY